MSAFGGKADIAQPPAMSAFDPKRTLKRSAATVAGYSIISGHRPINYIRIRPLGGGRHLTVLAQSVHRLVLTETAQFEIANLKDRRCNFAGESISHEQWPLDILAEEF